MLFHWIDLSAKRHLDFFAHICYNIRREEFMMREEMISYVYDDIKTRYSDCIHMIAFEMNFAGINRREKTNIGDDEKVRCVWAHWHEEFEIIAITGGTLMMSVDGTMNVLHEGDVLVIPPYAGHVGYCRPEGEEPRYDCMLFGAGDFLTGRNPGFDEEIVNLTERRTTCRQVFRKGETGGARLAEAVRRAKECSAAHSPAGMAGKISAVYEALSVIFEAKTGTAENVRRKNLRFVNEVMEYISKNYQFPISSGDLADRMNYEHTVFCRMFRENFGANFSNYLREYRIRKSLEYSGASIPISLIATRVGFDNYTYFSTSFKEIVGVSPREYFGK